MTSSRLRIVVGALSTAALAACSSERVAGVDGSLNKCGANAVFGTFGEGSAQLDVSPGPLAGPSRIASRASAISVPPLSGAVVSYPGPSAQFNDTAARYLVVPQYPVQGSAPDSVSFRLTAGGGAIAVAPSFVEAAAGQATAQGTFDMRLRR
ncbi:MAG TPA: hypothetical protein VG432_09310, partial [Gemmatimonadaceae bacterium]|nr:hypothetical protein [Gemmatimonadaceae bacterium]